MKKVILLCACAALMLVSCNKKEIEYLKYQKDSVLQVKDSVVADMNNYMSMIEEVQANFRTIKSAELGILEESQDAEGVTSDSRAKIQQDFQTITDAIRNSNAKLASMDSALTKAKGQASYFRGLVSGLQRDLKERAAEIKELKAKLDAKDIKITELDSMVASLNIMQDSLSQVSAQQAAAIQAQDEALNSAYYLIGNKKDLKAKGLKEKMLKTANVNKSIFTKVDVREFTQLDLNSKKAFLLTSHPSNSYTLTKKSEEDKNLVLTITNYSSFWANSKILVIQTK